MTAISPADGPVAVTGASGYIGSWIVRDLLEHGYQVRGCVRDRNNAAKVEHLIAMNNMDLRGNVELFEGDLFEAGSYDAAFDGVSAVIHAGAAVGFNKESPQQVYDGCFTEVRHVVESAKAAGSVKRFVFTSSFAAAGHPRPEGYVFTEKDWCGDNVEGYRGAWTQENVARNRDIAYAMAKASAERMIYQMAREHGQFEAMAILPMHVLGPLLCAGHDQPWSWQNCLRHMLCGTPFKAKKGGRMLWNIVDVRDVARAHRLCAESTIAHNGSRYILSAGDRSGELFTWRLQARLQQLFGWIDEIGGEEMEAGKPVRSTYDSPRAYALLAKEELGLRSYPVDETLRATGESLQRLGLLAQ